MSIPLYRQIRDLAPQNWTSGELVVALMIADSANEETRRSYIDAPELARRSRMSERGVSKALERLKERGFEFRVGKGKDRNGKEVYATAGKQVEYQVPDIFMALERGAAVAYGLVDKLAAAGTTVPAVGELSTETSRYHSTGEPVPQYRLRRSHAFCFDLEPPKPPKHLTKVPDLTGTGGTARKVIHRREMEKWKMAITPTPKELLDLPLGQNDAGAETVRGYLVALLTGVWNEGEGYSGKRPFGNSSWECELFAPMIKAGVIDGTLDEDGYLEDLSAASEEKARELITAAIATLGEPEHAGPETVEHDSDPGEAAYLAYGDYVGWKNVRNERMPDWSDLPAKIRNAWCVGASAAIQLEASLHAPEAK